MLSELVVGPSKVADGVQSRQRSTRMGATAVADVHGKYYEAVSRGNVFLAHNVAAQAVSVALATTYTGLVLSNPLGNDKNFAILAAMYALSVAPAAIASLHLIGGASLTTLVTHTTPLAAPGIQNALLGSAAVSSAKADSAATIPTPGYLLPLEHGFTAAALPNHAMPWVDLGGLIVLAPGGFIALGALTAVTGFGGLVWEEIPI